MVTIQMHFGLPGTWMWPHKANPLHPDLMPGHRELKQARVARFQATAGHPNPVMPLGTSVSYPCRIPGGTKPACGMFKRRKSCSNCTSMMHMLPHLQSNITQLSVALGKGGRIRPGATQVPSNPAMPVSRDMQSQPTLSGNHASSPGTQAGQGGSFPGDSSVSPHTQSCLWARLFRIPVVSLGIPNQHMHVQILEVLL